MKTKNDLPLSSLQKRKRVIGSIVLCLFVFVSVVSFIPSYKEVRREKIYESTKLVLSANKIEEYKEEMYVPYALKEKAYGTMKKMSLTRETKKDANDKVMKVDVKDEEQTLSMVSGVLAPIIALKKEEVTIYQGNPYNASSNITSITDEKGEEIPYMESQVLEEDSKDYFTVKTDLDSGVLGDYTVTVLATDANGYKSEVDFAVHVIARPIAKKTVYRNPNPTVNAGSLIDIAYALVGSPYVAGGSSPSGFDCSGFVSYVYSMTDVSISRSTTGQYTIGTNVGRENMMPGDILVWSSNGSYPTHTALYVGGGVMIHAANPRKGVIISNVNAWPETLLAVRRV